MCSFARISVPHTSHLSISIIWLLFGPVNILMNVNLCWHKIKRSPRWRFAVVREFRLDLNYKAVGDVWMINLKKETKTMSLLFTHTEASPCSSPSDLIKSQDEGLGKKKKKINTTHDAFSWPVMNRGFAVKVFFFFLDYIWFFFPFEKAIIKTRLHLFQLSMKQKTYVSMINAWTFSPLRSFHPPLLHLPSLICTWHQI